MTIVAGPVPRNPNFLLSRLSKITLGLFVVMAGLSVVQIAREIGHPLSTLGKIHAWGSITALVLASSGITCTYLAILRMRPTPPAGAAAK